jgi:hypothetical protein
MCEQTPFPTSRNDTEGSIGYALDCGDALTPETLEKLRQTHDDVATFDEKLQAAKNAAALVTRLAADVRKQVPPENVDPTGFLLFEAQSPTDRRDGFFQTDGDPCITVFRYLRRPDGSVVRRAPIDELFILAHEFGHFRSWHGQSEAKRAHIKRLSAKEVDLPETLTEAEKADALAEETSAWDFARNTLAALLGFAAWPAFERARASAEENDLRKYGPR